MIEFDFANSTFSFAVTVISTVLGIFFPLFTESVRKIDEQYESTILSKHFKEEWINKFYLKILVITLFVAFIAPFIMLNVTDSKINIIIIGIQCLTVLLLVIAMLLVNSLVNIYYIPEELTKHILGEGRVPSKNINKKLLPIAVDLIKYASTRKNRKVYQESKDYIFKHIYDEQHIVGKKNGFKEFNFSKELLETLYSITAFAADDHFVYPSNDNILAQAMYNIIAEYYNGENNYIWTWYSLNKIADSNCDVWFRQYWENAMQYYGMVMHGHFIQDERMQKNKRRFLELHQMLGALMVLNEKYNWLNIMLTYDRMSPYQFQLIPGTFSNIMDSLAAIEKQKNSMPLLSCTYPMNKVISGVSSDNEILEWAYRYFALLLIRLFSYNDYNINYADPMQQPYIESKSSSQLNYLKQEAKFLRFEIENFWYKNSKIEQVNLPEKVECTKVCGLLDNLIKKINDKIENNKANPKLDINRMKKLEELLQEMDNGEQSLGKIPTKYKKDIVPTKWSFILSMQIDTSACAIDGGYNGWGEGGWSNMPDILLQKMEDIVDEYMETVYSDMHPQYDFNIKEENIFKAFEKLKISSPYIIYSAGVYLGGADVKYNDIPNLKYSDKGECTYKGIKVVEKNSALSTIFIIKEDDMPKFEFREAEQNSDIDIFKERLTEIKDSKNHLYSNVPQIIEEHTNSNKIKAPIIVKLGRCLSIYKKEDIPFIRIRVVRNGDDTNTINNLKTLESYFVDDEEDEEE